MVIKRSKNSLKKMKNERLIKLTTLAAVLVASILIASKTFAYYLTGALSIKASLIDSILDACFSVLNLYAVHHALKPADQLHRFGYGKVEALAGLGQSLFIAISSLWLLKDIILRLYSDEPLVFHWGAVIVMVASSFLTILLLALQHYTVKRTRSLAISADALHYKADLFTNIGVLLCFLISLYLHTPFVDLAVAFFIVVYIFKTSLDISSKSFAVLIDRELDNETKERILSIALKHKEVKGIHDLRTRSSSQKIFIQLHVDLDKNLSLYDAHAIAEEIENKIIHEFPHAEVIIHEDPV